MEKRYPVRTVIMGTIAIWVIAVSIASFILEVGSELPLITNTYKTMAVVGLAIGAVILAMTVRQWQTKELFKKEMKKSRLFSVIVGSGIGIALFLSLRGLNSPLSLPYSLLSGFAAGFTLYKLRGGIRKDWIKDSVIVGFATCFVMSILLVLPFIFATSENFGLVQFINLLWITGGSALGAVLWGTVSSIAGHLISSIKRRLILFGAIALVLTSFLAIVLTKITAGPLLGVSPSGSVAEQSFFSLEGMVYNIPAAAIEGVIVTCFLSIFLRRGILKKINPRKNLASLPLAIKILIGYGIIAWFALVFYIGMTSNMLTVYPPYGLVSILVLVGAFLVGLLFLKKPSTVKGFLLFGFIIASAQAVWLLFVIPFYGFSNVWIGLINIEALLLYIFFSFFMVLWIRIEKMGIST
jgi:hypothetical protein